MNRLRTTFCNLLLFASCLPGYIRFRMASRRVRKCQIRNMKRLLRRNRRTEYGIAHSFESIKDWDAFTRLPLTEYKDYSDSIKNIRRGKSGVLTKDSVQILQPTSGSSSASKLIPHTKASANQFKSALEAWIADLFIQRPRLFLGTQYWSISPATAPDMLDGDKVPVGFLDDAEYFGAQRAALMNAIMAVPADLRQAEDMEANQYITSLFLLRQKNLRLISVWHPSFLTILLKVMKTNWTRLLADIREGGIDAGINIPEKTRKKLQERLCPMPKRSSELMNLDSAGEDVYRQAWPHLQIISCWRSGNTDGEIIRLEKFFPGVLIQGKGLLATEGVVSIPFGTPQKHVCAATSHLLEFQDDIGVVHPLWDLEEREQYQVILTTGAGLYRYKLGDRVEVSGFYGETPCIRFLGRAGMVSDFVGEKLHIEHVDRIVNKICERHFDTPDFAMLFPSKDGDNLSYRLLVQEKAGCNPDTNAAAACLEAELSKNYHYAHARRIGQLKAAGVALLGAEAQSMYRELMARRGAVAGTVKFPSLCSELGIDEYLLGTVDIQEYSLGNRRCI